MPRRDFKIPFAVAGDTTSIPTEIQSDGSVSITQGYGPDYERPTDGTDPLGKVFPRAPHNALLNEITASIGEIQQNGFPLWSPGMVPYPAAAWVRYADKVWQNTIDSNSAAPDAANSGWTSPGGTAGGGGRVRITSSATFVVPDGVTTIYVSGCGGGGGGGSGGSQGTKGSAGGGGGGGAGRSVISEPITVTGGQSIAVTIGTGGVGGASGAAQAGTAGGATKLGSLLTLAGGTGGGFGVVGDFGAGAAGGSPGGGWGTDGIYGSKGGDGGQGGSGPFGTAGGGARARQGSSGGIAVTIAYGYGTGGGGGGAGYASSGGVGTAGGAGMPGMLLIEW